MEIASREFSRKDMLKMGLLGSAAFLLPLERMARTQIAVADRLPTEQLPPPFQLDFVKPPVAEPVHSSATTDYYEMAMKCEEVEILPGLPKTEVWGYEGITPGPTIEVRKGRNVVVRHKNEIDDIDHKHTSVHLHGNASLPQYDGYANDTTAPGEYKDYHYPNNQDARTLWYHDHGVHDTALNAYMGCAAFYITHDELEDRLPIPKGDYDVPLVLRDAIFGTDGSLIFDDGESRSGHDSLFGDVILANGRPWPVMEVERRKYRFRVLNASISRGFKLALSTGDPLTVIGTDGGLMPERVETRDLVVGMAERYEFVIDFAKYEIDQQIVLQNLGVENNVDYPTTGQVMRFDVKEEAKDLSNNEVPAVLNPHNEVMNLEEVPGLPVRRFEFGRTGGMWTINDEIWDPNRVDANPQPDSLEIWEFTNKSGGWFHPIHVHLVDFRILSRTDGANPGVRPYERGPKDVAYVGENETVRVLIKFGPQKGRYMMHCHNLVHEDHDMMTQFEVGSGGPAWASVPAKPISEAPPLFEEDDSGGGSPGGGSGGGSPGGGSPGSGSGGNPGPVANAAPVVTPLRPRHNSRTRDFTPTLVARVSDSGTDLSKGNMRLYLDNREVKNFAYNRATNTLSYTSRKLRRGRHVARIVAADAQGRRTTKTWNFSVVR
ncbi:multicopper oxidase family protein [Rubrobacter marinus]|uniref:multicopper oxidase family protein n=1 Tax=Rubrobacter marinus TaxID=2653852 RepID=UPI001A9EC617|nr:multicopper oxidase domain-containing protein [Rubrobacter marinus]